MRQTVKETVRRIPVNLDYLGLIYGLNDILNLTQQ
jgi:hypothetical protein